MEIRQLKYFVNAAKTLSFTEAARLSNVAQSTLSQQVKQLETELDVPLFHRMGKQIQLTTEGSMFLEDAQRLLDDARQGLQRLADLGKLEEGSVHIGIAAGLGLSALLTDVLTEYNKLYPRIELKIRQVSADKLAYLLRQHEIDLAMTFTSSTVQEGLQAQPLFGTRICAVVGEHHRLEAQKTVSIEQLIHQPLVLPNEELVIRQRIDAAAKEMGISLRPAVEIDNLSHIIYMVRTGRWVSLLPDVATLSVRGIVRLQLDRSVVLPTSVYTLEGVYQRKAVKEFIRLMKENARRMLRTKDEYCTICGETFMV